MKNIRKSLGLILAVLMIFSAFGFAVSADEECSHSYETTNVAPTCVDDGYTLYVCVLCGYNYKVTSTEAKALGHNYGDWKEVEAPSCVKEGISKRDCARCGAADSKTIPVKSHADNDGDGQCDSCEFIFDTVQKVSPFDWLIALFNAIAQWFRDIFA